MQKKQKGIAITWILAMITLFTATMAIYSVMARASAVQKLIFDSTEKLNAQVSTIHSSLTNCALLYPTGNNGTGFQPAYPGGSNVEVVALDCPGSTYTNKNLWTGRGGERIPNTPTGMSPWMYTNNASGIFLQLSSNGDPTYNTVLLNLQSRFATAQTSLSGGVLTYWVIKN